MALDVIGDELRGILHQITATLAGEAITYQDIPTQSLPFSGLVPGAPLIRGFGLLGKPSNSRNLRRASC